MTYLEKCDSPEKIVSFLEKLEQAITNQLRKQESTKNKKPDLAKFLTIFIITCALVGLAAVILFRYKRKKSQTIK